MIQIELTSKLVLAIIGLTSVGAILVPTYAVPTIRSADIFDETIQSVDIKNGEVKNADLGTDAVTREKIQDGTIVSADMADQAIISTKIADSAITSSKLAGGAVKPNVHQVQGNDVTIGAQADAHVSANCPAGEIVTGGGFITGDDVQVSDSSPSVESDGWSVSARNEGFADQLLRAYALCEGPFP